MGKDWWWEDDALCLKEEDGVVRIYREQKLIAYRPSLAPEEVRFHPDYPIPHEICEANKRVNTGWKCLCGHHSTPPPQPTTGGQA